MEETSEPFDFSDVPAPVVVEEEEKVVVPAPVVVEEEKVVVPAPVVVEEEKVVVPAPVVVEEEKILVPDLGHVSNLVETVVPPARTSLILPGVPTPSRPFKLRFGLRNKL